MVSGLSIKQVQNEPVLIIRPDIYIYIYIYIYTLCLNMEHIGTNKVEFIWLVIYSTGVNLRTSYMYVSKKFHV
jgi:hypothetical protein